MARPKVEGVKYVSFRCHPETFAQLEAIRDAMASSVSGGGDGLDGKDFGISISQVMRASIQRMHKEMVGGDDDA